MCQFERQSYSLLEKFIDIRIVHTVKSLLVPAGTNFSRPFEMRAQFESGY